MTKKGFKCLRNSCLFCLCSTLDNKDMKWIVKKETQALYKGIDKCSCQYGKLAALKIIPVFAIVFEIAFVFVLWIVVRCSCLIWKTCRSLDCIWIRSSLVHPTPVRSGEKCITVLKYEKMFPRQLSKQPSKELATFDMCEINESRPDANINIWETAASQTQGGSRGWHLSCSESPKVQGCQPHISAAAHIAAAHIAAAHIAAAHTAAVRIAARWYQI